MVVISISSSTLTSSIPLILSPSLLFPCKSNGLATTGTSTRLLKLSSLLAGTHHHEQATTKTFMNAENGSSAGRRITSFWKWRGHDIFTEVGTITTGNYSNSSAADGVNKRPSAILLHGFGASTTYWRETMLVLQNGGYEVHALDLLGQGRSSKPILHAEEGDRSFGFWKNGKVNEPIPVMGKNSNTTVEYSINLWANMVDDYARQHQLEEVVLMGNSLGSLVALSVATGDYFVDSTTSMLDDRRGTTNSFGYLAGEQEMTRVKGMCLFNCAVGLNSRNVIKNPGFSPLQRTVINALFDILNKLIFDNKLVLRYALDRIVTKKLLEDTLQSLYICSPERVDAQLVDSFYYPAKLGGEGAVEAIRQIYTNDPGLTPMEYHEKYGHILNSLPLHLIWGSEDVVTPINGDVGLFYCDRVANNRGGNGRTTMDIVKSGHVPFDDNPLDTHAAMMKWLENKVM